MKLNASAVSPLRKLIHAGRVDRGTAWTFSAADGNALLGSGGNDWSAYGAAHLGINPDAKPHTKAAYGYPVAKGGKVYLSGLRAAISRAGQQNEPEIEIAARRLLKLAQGDANLQDSELLSLCFALTPQGEVPDWIELIPAADAAGIVAGDDGRKWTLDAPAVAAGFRRPIPIDVNHATHTAAEDGRESPARGWVEALETRNGAVWGRVEWTAAGADAVRNKEYRFISPALAVNKAGDIVGLRSVGLVNDPNFNLALNRAAHLQDPADPDEEQDMLEKILAALGVAADAGEETALNAVSVLKNDLQVALNARSTPDLNRYVPRADFDAMKGRAETAETTLATNARKALDAEIEREVGEAVKAGKITPATRDFYIETCRSAAGLESFRKFVTAQPAIVPEGERGQKPPVEGDSALTSQQIALCKRMGIDPKDFATSATALKARIPLAD